MHKPRAVIFDIDGTMFNISPNRNPFEIEKCLEDEIVKPMLTIYEKMNWFHRIVVTGRNEIFKEITTKQLATWVIHPDKFYMRPQYNQKQDADLKKEIYLEHIEPNYEVITVFEDKPSIVKMYRELGVHCCQVSDGYEDSPEMFEEYRKKYSGQ